MINYYGVVEPLLTAVYKIRKINQWFDVKNTIY